MASARDAAVGKECSSEQAGPEGEEEEEQPGEAEQGKHHFSGLPHTVPALCISHPAPGLVPPGSR